MQIKTKIRYNKTPTKVAKRSKTDHTTVGQDVGQGGAIRHC